MSSSVPAAKAAIHAKLLAAQTGDPAMAGVELLRQGEAYSPRHGHQPSLVVIEAARRVTREWAALGQFRLEETFVIPVCVDARMRGDDLDAVEQRMWEIVAAVERAVISPRPDLDGAVRTVRPMGALEQYEDERHRIGSIEPGLLASRVLLGFACEQRISLS